MITVLWEWLSEDHGAAEHHLPCVQQPAVLRQCGGSLSHGRHRRQQGRQGGHLPQVGC